MDFENTSLHALRAPGQRSGNVGPQCLPISLGLCALRHSRSDSSLHPGGVFPESDCTWHIIEQRRLLRARSRRIALFLSPISATPDVGKRGFEWIYSGISPAHKVLCPLFVCCRCGLPSARFKRQEEWSASAEQERSDRLCLPCVC